MRMPPYSKRRAQGQAPVPEPRTALRGAARAAATRIRHPVISPWVMAAVPAAAGVAGACEPIALADSHGRRRESRCRLQQADQVQLPDLLGDQPCVKFQRTPT